MTLSKVILQIRYIFNTPKKTASIKSEKYIKKYFKTYCLEPHRHLIDMGLEYGD